MQAPLDDRRCRQIGPSRGPPAMLDQAVEPGREFLRALEGRDHGLRRGRPLLPARPGLAFACHLDHLLSHPRSSANASSLPGETGIDDTTIIRPEWNRGNR